MNAKRPGLDDNCKGRLLSPRFHSTLTRHELLSAGLVGFKFCTSMSGRKSYASLILWWLLLENLPMGWKRTVSIRRRGRNYEFFTSHERQFQFTASGEATIGRNCNWLEWQVENSPSLPLFIFMEQKIWFALVLHQLAILKNKFWTYYEGLLRTVFSCSHEQKKIF